MCDSNNKCASEYFDSEAHFVLWIYAATGSW